MGFIRCTATKCGIKISNRSLDTLVLARALLTDTKKHDLATLAAYFKIDQTSHHRADDDAYVCGQIFENLLNIMRKDGVETFEDLNRYFAKNFENRLPNYHIVILALNKDGMYNLNKIVSEAHLNHYFKRPRIPRSFCVFLVSSAAIKSTSDSIFTALGERSEMLPIGVATR